MGFIRAWSLLAKIQGLVMSLRIRDTGEILCAALHNPEKGDVYLPDNISYKLTVEFGVIVTTPEPDHSTHGRWWWIDDPNKPKNCFIKGDSYEGSED